MNRYSETVPGVAVTGLGSQCLCAEAPLLLARSRSHHQDITSHRRRCGERSGSTIWALALSLAPALLGQADRLNIITVLTDDQANWTVGAYDNPEVITPHIDRFELGLADRTIALFTSDHGYMIGHHGLQEKENAWTVTGGVDGPFRPNMFEEAIRVPLAIRWPGVVEAGTVVNQFISNVDLYSSILPLRQQFKRALRS